MTGADEPTDGSVRRPADRSPDGPASSPADRSPDRPARSPGDGSAAPPIPAGTDAAPGSPADGLVEGRADGPADGPADSPTQGANGTGANGTGGNGTGRRLRAVAGRVARVGLDILPALAVYAAVRVAGLVALSIMASSRGIDPWTRLTRYDGTWLLGIAQNGYDPLVPDAASGHPGISNIAFFPLYPLLVGGLSRVSSLDLRTAALVLTALAGLAAAVGLDRLGRRVGGSRTVGLVLVVLWAAWPHSVVLAMTYTEALFVALAVWSLVALLDRRWLTAGVLCLLAGATRPFGLALAAAVGIAAAVAVVQALLRRDPVAVVRPVLATLIAPLGVLGYWWWLWRRTGRQDAWFFVQGEQWRSTFDGGAHTLQALGAAATDPAPLVLVVCLVLVVVSVVLAVALAVDGAPLPVVVHSALVVVIVVGGANYDTSKARFLLAAFPLLLLPARALAGLRLRTLPVVLVGLVALSSWYNAYVLLFWGRSP